MKRLIIVMRKWNDFATEGCFGSRQEPFLAEGPQAQIFLMLMIIYTYKSKMCTSAFVWGFEISEDSSVGRKSCSLK